MHVASRFVCCSLGILLVSSCDRAGFDAHRFPAAAEASLDRSGTVGRWLEFDANVHGERTHCRIAVWVDGTAVPVVEYGAAGDSYGKHLPGVEKALTTLHR